MGSASQDLIKLSCHSLAIEMDSFRDRCSYSIDSFFVTTATSCTLYPRQCTQASAIHQERGRRVTARTSAEGEKRFPCQLRAAPRSSGVIPANCLRNAAEPRECDTHRRTLNARTGSPAAIGREECDMNECALNVCARRHLYVVKHLNQLRI